MTTFDRLEPHFAELLDELAPAAVPDYFDDMLKATARTRQRPAWTSLERLLPMQVSARLAPLGFPSWRPLVLLLVLAGLILALATTFLAGARPKLPPEFGPAKNGIVIYGNTTGDIMAVDPATGTTAVVIGGATQDFAPGLSPDGRTIMFVRTVDGADMLYTANLDGSRIKPFASGAEASWIEASPDSQQLLYIADGGGTPSIRNVATGVVKAVPVAAPVDRAWWLSSTKLLVVVAEEGMAYQYSTINVDGTDQTPLKTPDACCGEAVLTGRGLLAWTSWNATTGLTGRTHVLDIVSGQDTRLASTDDFNSNFLDPVFSPDGKWLAVKHAGGGFGGIQLALIAADGSGAPIDLEPWFGKMSTQIDASFSPDGTKLLVTYGDGTTWLYSVPGGRGAMVEWPGVVIASWQRLAP
ncbi:MAG: PD40 domain-containing protein [Chloroflexi bacterium]|nr:PD40 domain-containing protein [Chloroflexota bacterium]